MSVPSQPGKVAPKFKRKKRSLGYQLTKTYENEIKCYFTGILFQQNFTEWFLGFDQGGTFNFTSFDLILSLMWKWGGILWNTLEARRVQSHRARLSGPLSPHRWQAHFVLFGAGLGVKAMVQATLCLQCKCTCTPQSQMVRFSGVAVAQRWQLHFLLFGLGSKSQSLESLAVGLLFQFLVIACWMVATQLFIRVDSMGGRDMSDRVCSSPFYPWIFSSNPGELPFLWKRSCSLFEVQMMTD